MTTDELPLKEIIFDPKANNGFGMFGISEVLNPAIKENFVLLNEHFRAELSIQSKEKRTVFGPILIPGMKIFRDQAGEKYNLTIKAPTIEAIMIDFFDKKRTNNVVQDHKNEVMPGFTFYQSVITNELIPSIKKWEHLPIGSAFLGAYVNDDDRLQEIEEGKFKGWSIHAAFDQVPVNLSNHCDSKVVEDVLRGLFY